MKKTLILLLTLSFITAYSAELDQFTNRYEPLSDSLNAVNIKTNELTWNRIVFQIFKIKPKDFAGTYEGFLDTIHKEDVEAVRVAVDNALYKADDYCIVHRIILPDGTVKKVLEKADVYFNTHGNPIKMVGIVKEINDA